MQKKAYTGNEKVFFSQKSGLSAFIGEQLEVFSSMPPWAMNLLLTLIIAMLTEVTSNSATTTLILPILANLVSLWTRNANKHISYKRFYLLYSDMYIDKFTLSYTNISPIFGFRPSDLIWILCTWCFLVW